MLNKNIPLGIIYKPSWNVTPQTGIQNPFKGQLQIGGVVDDDDDDDAADFKVSAGVHHISENKHNNFLVAA